MKQIIWTAIVLGSVLSCERNRASTGNNVDTLGSATSDTIQNEKLGSFDRPCAYENIMMDLGVGIVIVPTTFKIFDDSLLTQEYISINMDEDYDKISVCSMFYKPDYGIMHFACTKVNKHSYTVLTSDSRRRYLPKGNGYLFRSWEEYIFASFGVRRKTNFTLKEPLRENPTATSDEVAIPNGFESFCPMQMEGDWIKVTYDCFYNSEDSEYSDQPCHNYIDKCENPVTGWIKWRNGNKLLIEILVML